MELKYIWVKKYKNIEETGFNFTNSERHSFLYKNNQLTLRIEEESTEGNFFGSNISSVTAIVGKNGSGKTTLAEFIHLHLSNFYEGSMSHWGIKPISIVIVGKYITYHKSLTINNLDQLEKEGYILKFYKETPFDTLWSFFTAEDREFYSNTYIYYSNIFDRRKFYPTENMVDISTNHLIFRDPILSSKILHKNHTIDDPYEDYIDPISAHFTMESKRLVDFVLTENYLFPFEHLPSIKINVDSSENNRYLRRPSNESEKLSEVFFDIESDIINEARRASNISAKTHVITDLIIKSYFVKQFLLNLIKIYLRKEKIEISEDDIINFIYILREEYNKIIMPNSLKPIYELKNMIYEITKISNNKEKRKEFNVEDYSKNLIFNLINRINIDLTNKTNRNIVRKFIIKWNKTFDFKQFGTYQFETGLSSGELSSLTFYYRFYYALHHIQQYKDIPVKSVTIFIDEGDVNLHPEWQRHYFKNIIDFLSKYYRDFKIQLILTTHSPFLLSDVPKGNIIFLDKDVDGKCKIVYTEEKKETFGSNIHTLLADSFFMENGFLGEFAKSKIEFILDKLTDDQYVLEKDSKIEQIIDLVGEPLIKSRLWDLYKAKLKSNDSTQDKKF